MVNLLRAAGLRPTRQRVALARLLLAGPSRHFRAEQLYAEAREAGVSLSTPTVYNILHQFIAAGLVREVVVEAGCGWFDTNTAPHMHMLDEDTGEIHDLALDPAQLRLLREFPVPTHLDVVDVDVIVRVRRKNQLQ